MDPTLFAGLALAGLAAYGVPGLSETHADYVRKLKKAVNRVRASRENYQIAKREGDQAAIRKAKQEVAASMRHFNKLVGDEGGH
jgi:hypothetical protein